MYKNRTPNTKERGTIDIVSSALFALLFVCNISAATDILDYQLKDLNSLETHHLENYRGSTVLMIFFQPDCTFCVKQSKILTQIQQECSDFQAIAVGVNGSRTDLQEEIRRMRTDYPAYEINSALQAEVGKVVGTPLMLIADKQGNFTQHLQGYQQVDTLIPILGEAGLTCL